MPDKTNEVLKAALGYAKKGFAVFPVHSIKDGACTCGNKKCSSPGKHPLTKNGVRDATKVAETIEAWFQKWPFANLAIATGKVSGVIVLDVDLTHGGDVSLEILESEHGPLPETPLAYTGRGRHYYFKCPPEGLGNKVNLKPGLDIRGDGGYVVAAPSMHIVGRKYVWNAEADPGSVKLASMPPWFYAILQIPDPNGTGQAATVLNGVDDGKRDDSLFRYACRLRQKNINRDEATLLVLKAATNCRPPLPEKEARCKIEQAWKYSPSMAATMLQVASNRPVVTGSENGLHVEWGDKLITADITKLKTHTDGRITGILRVRSFMPGVPENLHTATFNFMATASRSRWATMLAERASVIDKLIWLTMLEDLCLIVTDFIREGEPPVIINVAEEEPAPAEFLIEPILLKDDPVVLFGEMASGKSYIAQVLAYILALGSSAGDISGLRASKKHRILYLDWEAEARNISSRFCCLANGMGLPREKFAYRRCSHRLTDDVDKVREIIATHEIDFVVIDSLGLAAGGDLNITQPAMDFFAALRTLKISSLIVAHTAKNNNGHATIYGNAFFGNQARSIWEVRRYQEQNESEIAIGLIHRKMNYGKLERPMGFRLVFDPLSTIVYREDVRNIPNVEAARSLPIRIKEILGRDGPTTSQQLADGLSASKETIERTLRRMRDRGIAQHVGTSWMLLATKEEEELVPF